MVGTLNKKLFSKARQYIPGGVNSPVRSFKDVGGNPLFIKKAKGSKIFDVAGKSYIDYCLSFGALILGHAHPDIVNKTTLALKRGTSFGAPTQNETILAKEICSAIPSIERIRLVNSGTEAVMSAVRLARAYTQRDKVLKFQGSYHGHSDYLLVNNSLGIPKSAQSQTLTVEYNDLEILNRVLRQEGEKIACIIVEPVCGNMGVVLPQKGFLGNLRRLCDKYGMLLIFDEVITGFRFCYGGVQNLLGLKPDLTCLGKIIGAGFPLAAFGGKKRIMDYLSPEGNVYQAGTLSGNPLATTAALATLRQLKKRGFYKTLEKKSGYLKDGIESIAKRYAVDIKVNRFGSMFSLFFSKEEITNYASVKNSHQELFKKLFHSLLEKGIYFSPSGYEACFFSSAHTQADLNKMLEAIKAALKRLG